MYCPIYRLTMRSAHCLEYQARARGNSLKYPKKSLWSSETIRLWQDKYKPCLTCETGRLVRKQGGGDDSDVLALIAEKEMIMNKQKTCKRCGYSGPENDFHHVGGRIVNLCKTCFRKAHKQRGIRNNLGTHKIVISFADYPEVLQALTDDAKRNFRSLTNEILYRLVSYGRANG